MRLFEPYTIKGLTLKNLIVMAPMATHLGTVEGYPSPAMIEHYRDRARGGTGLVIVEAVFANRPPDATTRLGLWSDDVVRPLGELARAIGDAGAVPAVQIGDASLRSTGRKPADLAPEELAALVASFVRAAERAAAAGFAAIELHGAHHTTLADFLSRRANHRADAYGGSVEGRARIVVEIVAGIRAALGADYPLFCRINGDEYILQGNTLKHSVPLARLLLQAGVDVIHVSAGARPEDGGRGNYSQARGRPAAWMPDGANLYLAAAVKKATGAPVIGVGKLGDPAVAEEALASGSCDLVALGRPLLADPAWARKVESGRTAAINRCRCCDRCMERFYDKKPVHCVTFAEA